MTPATHDKRTPLWVHGAGGHGCVVMEAARAAGWRVAGFVDDHAKPGDERLGLAVVRSWNDAAHRSGGGPVSLVVAIGDNTTRTRLCGEAVRAGLTLATVIHPTAWISPTAQVGDGVYVGAFAVVNAAVSIGRGAIVNTGAIVEHHNTIGDYAHIAPGATLGGTVRIGERALVGLGSTVRPGITIGVGAIVGAGAVVVADVAAGVTVVGVPAREKY